MAFRTRLPKATPRVPADTGARGVLNFTSRRKADNAASAGSGGAPSGPVRASGASPSRFAGVRGRQLAGAGIGAGAVVAGLGAGAGVYKHLGSGGGALSLLFGEPEPEGGQPPSSKAPTLFGELGESVGVPGSLLGLAVVAGVLIWLSKRRGK